MQKIIAFTANGIEGIQNQINTWLDENTLEGQQPRITSISHSFSDKSETYKFSALVMYEEI